MNEQQPYEQYLNQQWNELALPDIEMAWADMKSRLEEKRRRPFPFFWLNGCAGKALIGLLLIGSTWLVLRPERWLMSKKKSPVEVGGKENVPVNDLPDSGKQKDTAASKKSDSILRLNEDARVKENASPIPGVEKETKKQEIVLKEAGSSISATKSIELRDSAKNRRKTIISNQLTSDPTQDNNQSTKNNQSTSPVSPKRSIPIVSSGSDSSRPRPDNNQITKNNQLISPDSLKRSTSPISSTPDSSRPTPPIKAKEKPKPSSFAFSAGAGLQQLLPVAGQSLVPYNSLGRKGSLLDYVPSVFARGYWKDKWFIHAEFKYGAPQLTRGFLYISKVDSNQLTQKVRTTNTSLKKTYYSQLSFSMNYNVMPDWSIGGGLTWNRFVSAINSTDIIDHSLLTGLDSVVSSGLIQRNKKPDTNFVKSYWQFQFETQYRLKRFQVGARYSFGLQPYIHFTLPGGAKQEEKNNSLLFFIRYELFKTKNRNLPE